MAEANIQSVVEKFMQTLSGVKDAVMKRVDGHRIKSRLGENIETVNSPVSLTVEFFIVDNDPGEDQGVCLSIDFQNHKPVIGGLQVMKPNELYACADLSYMVGGRLSDFGTVRLCTDAPDFPQHLDEIANCITLYLNSQIPLIVEKLNEGVQVKTD